MPRMFKKHDSDTSVIASCRPVILPELGAADSNRLATRKSCVVVVGVVS